MSYTFDNLSPLDFESLMVDLLQKHLDIPHIESFKLGKDQGIDARFYEKSGEQHII